MAEAEGRPRPPLVLFILHHPNECSHETAKKVPGAEGFSWRFTFTSDGPSDRPIRRPAGRQTGGGWSGVPPTPLFFIVHLRFRHNRSLVEPEVWLRRYTNGSACTWARAGMKQKDGSSRPRLRQRNPDPPPPAGRRSISTALTQHGRAQTQHTPQHLGCL